MSMPQIPDINPEISINRQDAVNIIIASIAMEELALAHILNAEGEKLQYVLGTLEGSDPGDVTICDVMAVNNSIQKTLRDVIKAEMLLQFKLESAIEFTENEDECQLTIRGQKIWRDGDNVAGTRPDTVDIVLLRDGVAVKTVTIDSAGDGKFTFACLPLWKDNETKYTYQVDESDVPDYTKTISGYVITNTAQPGSITIECSKTWDDNNNQAMERPASIVVALLQNGVELKTETVNSPPDEESTVTFRFDDVPQFDSEGSPYVYTLDENPVTNYTKSIEGFNITNTYNVGP